MKPYSEKVFIQEGKSFLSFRRPQIEYEFSWHIHPEFEIVYCLKGWGTRYIGDSVEEYSSPELVFIPPGIPHSWQSDPKSLDNDAYVIHFQRDCFGSDWFRQNEFQVLEKLMGSDSAIFIGDCKDAEPLFDRTINNNNLKKVSAFVELLDFIISSPNRILGSFGSVEVGKTNPKMGRVIEWINKNFHKQFTLNELASEMSVSLYQLRSLFKRHTNKSALQYINELRVFEACRLMQNEEYTISYLSSLAGFNNLSYFNRIFLKVTGMTPRDYRKVFCG